jgi:hypothetical protein
VVSVAQPGVVEVGDAFEQIRPGDPEGRPLVEAVADDRAESVSRDDEVPRRGPAVGEPRRRGRVVLLDAHHLGAEPVDAVAQELDDLLLQAPAIHVHARRAHRRRHVRNRKRHGQLTVLRVDVLSDHLPPDALEPLALEPELEEPLDGVGPDGEAGGPPLEVAVLLVDLDGYPGAPQCQRHRAPADAAAGDDHLPKLSHPHSSKRRSPKPRGHPADSARGGPRACDETPS